MQEKALLLKMHNDARGKVASGEVMGKTLHGDNMPPGTIPPLVWDDKLAIGAQT